MGFYWMLTWGKNILGGGCFSLCTKNQEKDNLSQEGKVLNWNKVIATIREMKRSYKRCISGGIKKARETEQLMSRSFSLCVCMWVCVHTFQMWATSILFSSVCRFSLWLTSNCTDIAFPWYKEKFSFLGAVSWNILRGTLVFFIEGTVPCCWCLGALICFPPMWVFS